MKIVEYVDERGYKHLSMIRDNDPDHTAPMGLPLDPPDLDEIDWDEVKRELHNKLVDRRLVTMQDVAEAHNGVSSSILSVLKRRVITLYKLKDKPMEV